MKPAWARLAPWQGIHRARKSLTLGCARAEREPHVGREVRRRVKGVDQDRQPHARVRGGQRIEDLPHLRGIALADTIPETLQGFFDVRAFGRSEERRVGKECRSRWSQYDVSKKE